MTRISFTLPDVGLRELRGTAHVEDGFLVINIEDALLGLADAQRTTLKVAPEALSDVRIDRGLFRDKLIVEPKRASLLDAVPGTHRSDLRLRVSRKQRRDLERLLEDVERLLWH
jgi:hypothetical protein